MSYPLTERIIKTLCGKLSYERGEAYYRAGKVTFTHYDSISAIYEATVQDTEMYKVTVNIDQHGDVDAKCTCPALPSYDYYCKHIAAVLLNTFHIEHDGRSPIQSFSQIINSQTSDSAASISGISYQDMKLTNNMIHLFGNKPTLRTTGARTIIDSREILHVEFICKPVLYGYKKYMVGIEIRIGPKRTYVVQRIRDFLDRFERSEAFVFSKHFTYDPEIYYLQAEDDAIIQQLLRVHQHEQLYRDTAHMTSFRSTGTSNDRMLIIPPVSWEVLLPLLAKAPSVEIEDLNKRTYKGIHVSDEAPPLHFEFDQAQGNGYQLDVQGLDPLTIFEVYGMILSDGQLLKLGIEQCKRLSELKNMLTLSQKEQVQIPLEQMEPFIDKVIPGLMKLGSVHIAQTIADRIVHTPLQGKLYLDRVKDRLLASLEFRYGDLFINPLEGNVHSRSTDRILMRDGEQERRILELMDQSSFAKTESGYFMNDEDEEYEFLYRIVPELEKMIEIFATTAVKERLYTEHAPPQISIDMNDRTNWLEFKFDLEGIPETEIVNVLKSLEEQRKYYRMPNGALMPLESAEFQEIIRFMNEMGVSKGDLNGTEVRLPVVRGLHLIDAQQKGNTVKLGKSLRRLLENMRNPDNLDFTVPEQLEPILRDYQKFGFQWMKTLAHYRFGGILADDMGLGKTLQSIAFISSVLPEIRQQKIPAMIVCPASLVYNWRNELHKFSPEIRTAIADGTKTERSRILKDMSDLDVIITSYPLLRRDIELYIQQTFHTLIFDEAQAFKNHNTQTAQTVRELQSQYKFALTGTPVENRLEELWSIFETVFPELFPGRKAFNDLSRATVAKRIRPFLLRRLKSDVLKELPEKIESLQASELLPDQKKLYAAYLAMLQQETLKHLHDKGFQKNRIKILAGLTRLRQLCCHPALFVEDYKGSSSKFEQLLDIIEECRNAGKRLLVFSQFTSMLSIIGRELGIQGVPYFYLDGQTPSSERVELCNRFNGGERDLFLISLKAGGTGLNLTGADTVILYDLWWNPAVEQQAADRAHRIGQKKVVQVIRLVTQGTVEDKMYELQQKKKNLIDEVIKPGQEALSSLTEEEIREILMI